MVGSAAVEDAPEAREETGSRDALRWLILGSVAFSAFFISRTSFTVGGRRSFSLFDDGMISMTYARNLVHGHGLVWNAGGARVEGITNPLWTFLMAGVQALGAGDHGSPLVVMLVGAGLLVACALLARSIAERLLPGSKAVGTLAAAFVVTNYALVYWTLRGMEVGFVALLALAATLYALRIASDDRKRTRLAVILGAIVAVGISTRIDFGVFAVVVIAYLLTRLRGADRRRVVTVVAGIGAAAFVIQEAARYAYYGTWLPNTYTLKVVGIPMQTRLWRGVNVFAFGALEEWGVVLLFAVFAVVAVARVRTELLDRLLPCAVFAASVAYSTWVGGDAWEWMRYPNRYVVAGLAVLSAPAAVGIVTVARHARAGAALRVAAVVALGLTLVALVRPFDETLLQLETAAPWMRGTALFAVIAIVVAMLVRARASATTVAVILTIGVAASASLPGFAIWWSTGGVHVADDAAAAQGGALVARITTADAKVAVVWAGAPIYFAHRTGVDILGKSDPRIAKEPPRPGYPFHPGHAKWDVAVSVGSERPDLVLQLWKPTQRDVAYILGLGYRAVAPVESVDPDHIFTNGLFRLSAVPMFARADSRQVRWDLVKAMSPDDLARITSHLPAA